MAEKSIDASEIEPLPVPTKRRMHGPEYTPAQLAEKEATLKTLARDWPELSAWHHELVYDFVATTPEAEIEAIIESGEWDRAPSKFAPDATQKIINAINKQQHASGLES